MSENSKCNTGCVTGTKTVATKLPNLVSPCEVVGGKRPCKGRLPFNVPWCHRTKGWPAGSMVYTKCGFFFNLERAYGNPADADSEWIEFDFKFLFNKLLNEMACDNCPTLDGHIKRWDCSEGVINLATAGETWCFTTVDADGEAITYFACAKESDLVKDILDKPEAWSDPKTPHQLMCELLNIDDTRLTNPRWNGDKTAYVWDIINKKGKVIGTETQPAREAITKCGDEPVDGPVVQCDQMGEGLVWDEESGTWVIDSNCGPGYMCLPNGCGTILWGYAVITADRTVHKVELPVTLNAAVDPSQTSVTITDFGDSKQVDGQLIDDGDTANLTSRQSNSDLSWVSMLDNPESSIGIYEVKSNTDSLPSKTVTWVMMTNRTCA